jgi:putative peptidoglycan lipid II flippase
MKKTALIIMLITIISKFIGFTRELTLSYFYGATGISDAFLVSITIPGVIFGFIGTGLATSYIPMFSSVKNNEGVIQANHFTNNLLNFILLLCSFIIIIGILFTDSIVKLFALGFEGNTLELAVSFTRVSLVGVFFTGLTYIFTSYLQVNKKFIVPALIGLPLNFILIIFITISSMTNPILLSMGIILALASQLFLLLPYAYKEGYRYSFILDSKDTFFGKVIQLSIPVILGASVNQINTVIDRTLASQLAVGGISALNYANRLNGFVQGIFVLSIATVMYPMISTMAAEDNIGGLKKTLLEAINSINILVIPATIGALIFAEPIVSFLFGRGAFDYNAVSMTSSALFFYSIGMIGFGLREVLSRAFYSLQDTRTPMINGVIAVSLNIVLNIILSKFLGLGGLALATSISAIFCTLLLFISLRKKIGQIGIKNILISISKILLASMIMALIARLTYNELLNNIGNNLSLVVAIGIGAIVYFIAIYIFRIEEVDLIKVKLQREFIKITQHSKAKNG